MFFKDARFACACLFAVTTCSVGQGEGEADDFVLYTSRAWASLPAELVCEGHDYSMEKCQSFSCCSFSEGECWSTKGEHPCVGSDLDADAEPLQQNFDESDSIDGLSFILVQLRDNLVQKIHELAEQAANQRNESIQQTSGLKHLFQRELGYVEVFELLGSENIPNELGDARSEFLLYFDGRMGDEIKEMARDLDDPGQYLKMENMTVASARAYCVKLPRCLGFTFLGSATISEDMFKSIYFKSRSDLGKNGWTTYLHKGMESSLNPSTTKPAVKFRGSLKSLQSEPVPDKESLYTGSILNLVGSTFKDVTQNLEKDVFVSCYAPWCGFCQRFKEPLGKLAKSLRHMESVVIAQIDATSNAFEGLTIESFPTIVLFPAGQWKDQPVKYIGNRQPADMFHWLQKHATYGNFSEHQETAAANQSGLLGDDDDDTDDDGDDL